MNCDEESCQVVGMDGKTFNVKKEATDYEFWKHVFDEESKTAK